MFVIRQRMRESMGEGGVRSIGLGTSMAVGDGWIEKLLLVPGIVSFLWLGGGLAAGWMA